ncbi:MAG: [Desulfovibrionaceae bacterium]|nr:[FeFe] hydrogenase H-cluster radical SAM maturase HydE [Desulfovibrionaceae bacterium]
MRALIDRLCATRRLDFSSWKDLLSLVNTEAFSLTMLRARKCTQEIFKNAVYVRGIIECTNHCVNSCSYCGLQVENRALPRYRLPQERIVETWKTAYAAGLRTLVLQGGEDPYMTDEWLTTLIAQIKKDFPDCAITLSFGERSRESYQNLREAGADRYLLRHECASPILYRALHGKHQAFWRRIEALYTLRDLGYQTGCGMMIGVPGQSIEDLAEDMAFIQEFSPAMIGIGPFLPHHATVHREAPPGDLRMTLYVASLCRLLKPEILMPATTALRSLSPMGLRLGVQHGCNVVMPSLTPDAEKAHYSLYDRKCALAHSLTETLDSYAQELSSLGAHLSFVRGDARDSTYGVLNSR